MVQPWSLGIAMGVSWESGGENWKGGAEMRRGQMWGNPKLLLWAVLGGVESLGNMSGGSWNVTSIEMLLSWRQEMVQEIPK